jgi:hypothetical protein
MSWYGKWRMYIVGAMALLQTACAGLQAPPPAGLDQARLRRGQAGRGHAGNQYTPVFVVAGQDQLSNRIGTPAARLDEEGCVQVFVDPATATAYFQEQTFCRISALLGLDALASHF